MTQAEAVIGYCEKLSHNIPICAHYSEYGVYHVDCQHSSCRYVRFCKPYNDLITKCRLQSDNETP